MPDEIRTDVIPRPAATEQVQNLPELEPQSRFSNLIKLVVLDRTELFKKNSSLPQLLVEESMEKSMEKFISNAEDKFHQWRGFPFPSTYIELNIVDLIEREAGPYKLPKLMKTLSGEQPLTMAQLKDLDVYFKILEARYSVMTNRPRANLSGKFPKKESRAHEFVTKIGTLMGNPVVKAILKEDHDTHYEMRKTSAMSGLQ